MKLKLSGVRKTYSGGIVGVDGIDLEVSGREMSVLLGPSGCGKTTLLRLISGLETPDEGKVYIDGEDVTNRDPRSRDVAMVFQNYALYPHMTVGQNIVFGLKARKVSREKTAELLRWAAGMLELEPLLDRRPKELSGGQRQRVALGRAVVRKPKLYLFDEPLSNLDAELRMRMRGEILTMHRRVGGTSIYVTHDQVEAMSLADRIHIMKDGRITASGTPADLYENPPDIFTAGFLGFPAMNLIPGKIEGGEFVSESGLRIPVSRDYSAIRNSVILGIRPEDIAIDDSGEIKGEVRSLENLGSRVLLYVKTAARDNIKVIGQGNFSVGQAVALITNPGRVRLFDESTGERLLKIDPND